MSFVFQNNILFSSAWTLSQQLVQKAAQLCRVLFFPESNKLISLLCLPTLAFDKSYYGKPTSVFLLPHVLNTGARPLVLQWWLSPSSLEEDKEHYHGQADPRALMGQLPRVAGPAVRRACQWTWPQLCPVASASHILYLLLIPWHILLQKRDGDMQWAHWSLMMPCSVYWSLHLAKRHSLLSQYIFYNSCSPPSVISPTMAACRDSVLCRNSDKRGDICRYSCSNLCA